MIPNTNLKNIMTKTQTTDFFLACKESRIENNTSFYGCFYLGPFDDSLSQTLANDLRRTLLSELTGLAITSIEIEGILHKFSSLPGMKESVLDLICNLQTIVLKKEEPSSTYRTLRSTKKTYTGFLNVSGPRVIKAMDLKLPAGLQCIDPNQYVATLAEDGFLNMKFNINEGKNYIKQKPHNLDVTVLKKRNILLQNFKKKVASSSGKNSFGHLSIIPNGDVSKLAGGLSTKEGIKTNIVASKGSRDSFAFSSRFFLFPYGEPKEETPAKEEGRRETKAFGQQVLNVTSFKSSISNPISLDAVFMPVTKINCIIEENNIYSDFSTDPITFYNQTLDGNLPLRPKNNLLSPSFGRTNGIYKNQAKTKQHQISDVKSNVSLSYCDFQSFLNAIDYNSIYQTCLVLQKNNNNKIEQIGEENQKNNKVKFQKKSNTIFQKNLKLIPWQSNSLYFDINDISNETNDRDKGQLADNQVKQMASSFGGATPKAKYYKNSYRLWLSKEHSSFSKIKTFLASQHVSVQNQTAEKLPNLLKQKKLPLSHTKLAIASKPNNDQNKINTIKTALTKEKNTFKINPANGINQQNLYLEYAKNLKLKPLRKKSHLIVEIWTNGSIHPRQALYQSFIFLSNNFLKLQTVKMLGSMFKSELAYGNLKYSILNNYSISKADQVLSSFDEPLYVPSGETSEFISSSFAFGKVNLVLDQPGDSSEIKTSLNHMKFYSQASLKAPIGILKISLRVYTTLKKSGIFTLNDLVKYSKNDLLQIKKLGTKSLIEIETCLSYLGLTLKS